MDTRNNFKLESSARWNETDWSWEVWVKTEQPMTLAQIARVQYVMHPTFKHRLVDITDRASNFKLKGRGWGEFMIHANLFSSTSPVPFRNLSHWIKFKDKSIAKESLPTERPTIFLSYSRVDSMVAAVLRRHFEDRGLEVISSQDVEPGEVSSGVGNLLNKADAMVALISEEPSMWMRKELDQAKSQQIVTLPFLLGSNARLPSTLMDTQASHISDPGNHDLLLKWWIRL